MIKEYNLNCRKILITNNYSECNYILDLFDTVYFINSGSCILVHNCSVNGKLSSFTFIKHTNVLLSILGINTKLVNVLMRYHVEAVLKPTKLEDETILRLQGWI